MMQLRNEHRIAATTATVESARHIAALQHDSQRAVQARFRLDLAEARGAAGDAARATGAELDAKMAALREAERERDGAMARSATLREANTDLRSELRAVEDGKAAWMARLIASCSDDRGVDSPAKAGSADGFRAALAGAHPPVALERAEAQNAELRDTVDGLEQSLVQAKMELAMLKAQIDGF